MGLGKKILCTPISTSIFKRRGVLQLSTISTFTTAEHSLGDCCLESFERTSNGDAVTTRPLAVKPQGSLASSARGLCCPGRTTMVHFGPVCSLTAPDSRENELQAAIDASHGGTVSPLLVCTTSVGLVSGIPYLSMPFDISKTRSVQNVLHHSFE